MQYIADLHVHSVASGHAYSTVTENVRAAAERGLEIIALTDHGPMLPGAPHAYYFGNLRVIPDMLFGVRVLKGIEANIMDRQGSLDLDDQRLAKLDIVLAGLHTHCAPHGSVAENTEMLINALRNPWVDAIVHPGNPEYPVDFTALVQAAVEYDVALEINNSSLTVSRKGSLPFCHTIAGLAKQYGAKILLGTDSHFAVHVGNFDAADALLAQHGITEEQILNTSRERLRDHLTRRGRVVNL